jgi:peptide-methionine (S)-S-oxide reductase
VEGEAERGSAAIIALRAAAPAPRRGLAAGGTIDVSSRPGSAIVRPPPPQDPEPAMTTATPTTDTETAVLGGGCFWCLEAVFDGLAGVRSVESGYAGGARANPSYEQVCTGATGHAEVVRVAFDPSVLSFRDLLTVFFTIHDPTTKDRQGADVGSQYRSVIFCQSDAQRATTLSVIAELDAAKLWRNPIVTEVADAAQFYEAEPHHQEYFERNPAQAYCAAVVEPKVAKFRKHFADRLKKPAG